jgi:Ca-activated chloride channel homolog
MLKRMSWFACLACAVACGGASENAPSSLPSAPFNTGQPFQQPAAAPNMVANPTAEPAIRPNVPTTVRPSFVLTQSDPFSTFAADVDTASYDILRRSVLQGVLPPVTEVRAEEFINYFDYGYPLPDLESGQPFMISLAASAHVDAQRRTKLLRVGIQGALPDEVPAANLVFLVDVSGSMAAENKLPLVKVVLNEVLSELHSTDTVSIVTYAADTRVRLGPTKVRDRSKITAAINALQPGGGTNGASGIELAYQQAQSGFLEEGINHVILCTDGDFNLGIVSTDALVQLIEQKRKSGVTLTALGFGDRNNDWMMERVSNAGNGIYSVLYNQDQAVLYAHERLISTAFHIAKDMKIQVEFNPEQVFAYRLIGYEDRKVADDQFRNDRVDGGEVGAGHRVTALYELALTRDDLPQQNLTSRGDAEAGDVIPEVGADELVRVKVRWKKPGASSSDPADEVSASLDGDAIEADAEALDMDARWAVGVARLAEILQRNPLADVREFPRVRALLESQAEVSADRRELVSMLPQLSRLLGSSR